MKLRRIWAGVICPVLLLCLSAQSAENQTGKAADFPPGLFTDGGHYRISDFEGKVVVLYFGCNICPRNRGSVPQRNQVVQQFRDKPIRFLAITPAPMQEAREYAQQTRLAMPCFADAMGVMQHRYGTTISLQNIWQFRVIGPDGRIIGYDMSPAELDKAVAGVKWKFKDDGYDPRLANIVELLEWNHYEQGIAALKPFLKQKTKAGDSARQLYDKLKAEGEKWAQDADKSSDEDKIKALELYARVAACFPDEDMGKKAREQAKKLQKDKAVLNEQAARQMFARLYTVMSQASPGQKPAVIAYCQSIEKKYPDSPSGKAAADLAQELQAAAVAQ